ncbi:MAG TPA: type 1 glutamine amidotransferase domain-containing protein [Thermoanaerobaculia bacterium]|nr:type 1 glutamine amidotransferase domain-containing protein [Thermoanaerobaculia bacterium]
MATLLMPIPNSDFDPTETAVPWKILRGRGHAVVFATPNGRPGQADARMITGEGLGILSPFLRADVNGRRAYKEMEQCPEFKNPISYTEIQTANFDAILLPGGHAPGTKEYLESTLLQAKVVEMAQQDKPIGAICHGVLVAARSRTVDGASLLSGKKTTALTKPLELTGWRLTRRWLGNYYRTYPETTVEDEVKQNGPREFVRGSLPITRDSPKHLARGFTVLDGRYLSARWPGDAHRFGSEFADLVEGIKK